MLRSTKCNGRRREKNVWGSISGWVSQAYEDAADWTSQAVDDAADWTSTAWNDAGNWVTKAWEDTSLWTVHAWEDVSVWTVIVWEDVSDWTVNAWGDVTEWTEQAWINVSYWTIHAWMDSSEWVCKAWEDSSSWVNANWNVFIIWLNNILLGYPYEWIEDVIKGEYYMTTIEILLDYLKDNDFIDSKEKAKKEVSNYQVSLRKNEDYFVRDAITGLGTIPCENTEKHYYITSVKTGLFNNVLSYAIIHRKDSGTTISIYAHEGLIKQHLSEKAFKKLKVALV